MIGGANLEWHSAVLPVLRALADAYEARGSPYRGVSQDEINARLGRPAGDPSTGQVLVHLEKAGYIRETIGADQSIGPLYSAPDERALEVFRGWPTRDQETLAAAFLAALERQVESTTGPERERWERLRSAVAGVGKDMLSEVLAKVVLGAAGS
jgi:hypothetical protein